MIQDAGGGETYGGWKTMEVHIWAGVPESAESAESAESLDSEGCFVGCGMPRVVPLLVRLGLP